MVYYCLMDEVFEPKKGRKTKRPPEEILQDGKELYGETFVRYSKRSEIIDLLPTFKDFYYARKTRFPAITRKQVLNQFNDEIKHLGRVFQPPLNTVKTWLNKWQRDIELQLALKGEVKNRDAVVHPMIEAKAAMPDIFKPMKTNQLEEGLNNLGGELLKDATRMLADDQLAEGDLDPIVELKRRSYILGVMGQLTKFVHGTAAIKLKQSEEKRNTTSFLMDLIKRAASGQLSQEEMTMLTTHYAQPVEQTPTT